MKLTASPGRSLRGDAAVPGDKSCSHRALIFGAMAEGESRITGLLDSDDVRATMGAVEALGATVRLEGSDWLVRGGAWRSPEAPLDCGNSGTTARLLMGAVAGRDGVTVTLTGDASLSARPMRRVSAPLEQMGALVEGGEHLPLTVSGGPVHGLTYRNLPPSAQVKSAILLAGLGTDTPVEIIEPQPSRDHSEIMLGEFGVALDIEDTLGGHAIRLRADRRLKATTIEIGADPSSAAFPLVAAALAPGSEVTVRGMIVNSLRTAFYETLEAMGGDLARTGERHQSGERVADVRSQTSALRPCAVCANQIPAMIDEIPALAVACAFADGESVIEGLSELRVKETDRLAAIVAGLIACGVTAVADGDALRIAGGGPGSVRGGAKVTTRGDHRIAMAFLTLGLAAREPVTIDDGEMIATSFPGYANTMRALGADIR